MSFSASDSAFEGFRLTRRAPMAIALWALAYLLFSIALIALTGPALANFFAAMQAFQEAGGEPDVEALEPIMDAYRYLAPVTLPLALIISVVLSTAVTRAVVRPGERAFGYLRLGADELRVFVVQLVLILLSLAAGLAGGVFIGVVAGVLGQTNSGAGAGVAVLLGLALMCLLIWVAIRLSLAVPMTVAERRIRIFESWRLTKGRFWSLFGMMILAVILVIVVAILVGLISLPLTMLVGGDLMRLLGDHAGSNLSELIRELGPMLAVLLVVGAISETLQRVILYAPWASAYQQLSGRE